MNFLHRQNDHDEDDSKFGSIMDKLDRILSNQETIMSTGNQVSQDVLDLQAQVASDTTVQQSVITLLNGLSTQLGTAKNDPAAVEAIIATMKQNSAAIAAAIVANTPAAPPSGSPSGGGPAPAGGTPNPANPNVPAGGGGPTGPPAPKPTGNTLP